MFSQSALVLNSILKILKQAISLTDKNGLKTTARIVNQNVSVTNLSAEVGVLYKTRFLRF